MRVPRLSLSLAMLLLVAGLAPAQQPPQPNPAAPNLNPVVPLGMARGTSLELTLTGANLANPTGLWTDIPGARATIPTDNNNGKDATKLRVKLEVPADAPLGFYGVRLATARGLSNLRLFCVDELPQVMEVETNRTRQTAQPVPVPGVVVGRADAEATDHFKVTVKASQRLSFEVLGRRLGSALDPVIALIEPRTGRQLAYSEDAPGLQSDPRLTYTFKEAGEYILEVRDTQYRGGADQYYRLRIGDFPCATTPIPMAAKRGSKTTVSFAGPTVDGVAPVTMNVPSDPAASVVWVTPRGTSGQPGWPVALDVSDVDEGVEVEPNNEPAKATRVPVPGGITGRFLEKNDIDHYVFAAKKGQRLIIEAQTLEWYSPTEVYMVLKDAKGAQVAATNPASAPRLDFTATADGDFTLSVEHLHLWGGPSETYHLSIAPYQPGFDLSAQLDRYDAPQGGSLSLPILLARRDYAGPVEVEVVGPAGFSGKTTVAMGQPAKPGTPAGQLVISVAPDVAVGAHRLRLQGKATINGQVVVQPLTVMAPVKAALANLAYPPRQLAEGIALAVTERAPFTLALKLDGSEAARGVAATLTVSATRAPGFTEEIALAPGTLPANVAAALKPIPKGANDVKVTVTAAANATIGTFPITLVGKAKHKGADVSVTSTPLSVAVTAPFELKAEPLPLKLMPGAKAKLKVTATRKGGYTGPIALEVRNLPAGVTAEKATLALGQASAELELTAAPTAAAGDKADVNVLGTATAAGNVTGATANFTVSVPKK